SKNIAYTFFIRHQYGKIKILLLDFSPTALLKHVFADLIDKNFTF
ncbi:MAG: hypothetical protein ACJAXN_003021, partial [Psychromonas sp.]